MSLCSEICINYIKKKSSKTASLPLAKKAVTWNGFSICPLLKLPYFARCIRLWSEDYVKNPTHIAWNKSYFYGQERCSQAFKSTLLFSSSKHHDKQFQLHTASAAAQFFCQPQHSSSTKMIWVLTEGRKRRVLRFFVWST